MSYILSIVSAVMIIITVVIAITSNNRYKIDTCCKSDERRNFPKCSNEDTSVNSDAYVQDKSGEVLKRADDERLDNADVSFLMRKGYYEAIGKHKELQNRQATQIITAEDLNDRETMFFCCLADKMLENGFNPGDINISRLSSGAFNVYHYAGYVGKVYIPKNQYRVIKVGGTRATRVFDSLPDAENYIYGKSGYIIEDSIDKTACWIQCLHEFANEKTIESTDIKVIIDEIPSWIEYIRHLVRNYNSILDI